MANYREGTGRTLERAYIEDNTLTVIRSSTGVFNSRYGFRIPVWLSETFGFNNGYEVLFPPDDDTEALLLRSPGEESTISGGENSVKVPFPKLANNMPMISSGKSLSITVNLHDIGYGVMVTKATEKEKEYSDSKKYTKVPETKHGVVQKPKYLDIMRIVSGHIGSGMSVDDVMALFEVCVENNEPEDDYFYIGDLVDCVSYKTNSMTRPQIVQAISGSEEMEKWLNENATGWKRDQSKSGTYVNVGRGHVSKFKYNG